MKDNFETHDFLKKTCHEDSKTQRDSKDRKNEGV